MQSAASRCRLDMTRLGVHHQPDLLCPSGSITASMEVAFFDPQADIGALEMHESMRVRIKYFLARRGEPYLG
jgi:hypothetical protein